MPGWRGKPPFLTLLKGEDRQGGLTAVLRRRRSQRLQICPRSGVEKVSGGGGERKSQHSASRV